ncbi:ArsR/SmtB family transcription factor [Cohnella cholangitidis]|uniref:Metalloregulator ArsR/SmtB family transcription factor n=1 Tax=Cohnella cholangitidis TaxID=2598458 RepID=A0A7G5BSC9_9BACL|nr:metalloregulator ArsR/SmtB family transcription factor [Cohnella cholangitidis]QMV39863.1 metalloregulator ArsR/SmtB family transcription factor [Cohnella cholangitidis]
MENVPSAKAFKDSLYQQYARIGKCLSSDKRLELLNLLAQSPKSVEKLAQQTDMSVANVSRHLQVLLDARLVKFSKKGTFVIYSLADPAIHHFLTSLWRICESQLADIQRIQDDFRQHYENMQTLSGDELKEKMEAGSIILLDIRSKDEFDAGHIDGAISVPMEELDLYLRNLPRHYEVAAYCRGPFCIYSAQAVEKMQSEGFTAYRLDNSIVAGYSVEAIEQ